MFLAIFSVVILIGVGLYFFGKRINLEDQEDKSYLPDDGMVYDPVAGRMITLEEAEHGVVVSDDMLSLSRIKTVEEIETFYSADKKEKEYIRRELMLSGAVAVDIGMLAGLRESVVLRELASFQAEFMFEVIPGRYLGVALMSYRLPGHTHPAGSEYQFVGFISGADASWRSGLKDLETEVLPTGVFLRLPRVILRADLDGLLALMHEGMPT